jgi:SpoVK/Ycf46/Vps4 family AAA+-type ATPase
MPITTMPINKKEEKIEFFLTEPFFSFDDVVLSDETVSEIQQILALYSYSKLIFESWGLGTVIKNQRKISINLYGNSGTGKTMTAHAIAKSMNKKLLIVNYAEIESKFVGETSKNIVRLFDYACQNDAVILFDEADALLSKRVTSMQSAADVSVNQTRNVLLKILDEYQGIVIFTTNFISNFDSAFLRRIFAHIRFDLPNKEMRIKLWKHYLVEQFPLVEEKNGLIEKLSESKNISGCDISNAILKTAIYIAVNKKRGACYEDLKRELDNILKTKREYDWGDYSVSERKVSAEYVKEQIKRDNNGVV